MGLFGLPELMEIATQDHIQSVSAKGLILGIHYIEVVLFRDSIDSDIH